MKSKYKIIIIITILLLILSVTISTTNYIVSIKSTQTQLKTQALPLSIDNIYTEIQKNIIEPYLVSSMMANDTFLKDWLLYDENNEQKITKYLQSIKDKYKMMSTFLVSQKTEKYYTQNGFLEKVKKDNKDNQWYFKFKDSIKNHEINLDFNKNIAKNLIMFINCKIYDYNHNFIGATGIGIEVTYIKQMLNMFKERYHLNVYFLNKEGKIVLNQKSKNNYQQIDDIKGLRKYKETIVSKKPNMLEYIKNGDEYILKTKYIPELDIYLVVEAKVDDFAQDAKKIFHYNLAVSLIFTLIFSLIIMIVLKKYHNKLENLANFDSLTQLSNRRNFKTKLEYFIQLHSRNETALSLLFVDIDNFKIINDTFGHKVGDDILIQFASILSKHIRQTDLVSRWGGEEFVIALIDTDIEDSLTTAQKIREAIQSDEKIKELISRNITASFGLTTYHENDTIDTFISRADNAMYNAKENGKNKVVIAP
ncbi:MAG: diguanylate cyclase (GGDEF)-like protein [Sulfurimonas sp.]|jgi:diguanylate cyclase (GGDEF)-like protein